MATDALLLNDPDQRQLQLKLREYHVDGVIAKDLAQILHYCQWTPSDVDAILRKVEDPSVRFHRFIPDPNGIQRTSNSETEDQVSWIRPPFSEIERAAHEKQALCVNSAFEWTLRSEGYVAISHVWEEGIQADGQNRGVPRSIVEFILAAIDVLHVSWIWLDCLAIPGDPRRLTVQQEEVKRDIINNLSGIYRKAEMVVIMDAFVMRLKSLNHVDVALSLWCGKWMRRVWTMQEICLARNAAVLTALGPINFKEIVQVLRYLSSNENGQQDVLGKSDPSISRKLTEVVNARKYDIMYTHFVRLVLAEGQTPALTALARSCRRLKTGNDVDYARAFFPLLGLEWKLEYSREEGMRQIYESQPYFAKRLLLQYGSPRSQSRPGWAPSHLTGLEGQILTPGDPLGDVEWERRGLRRRWYTYKVRSYTPGRYDELLTLFIDGPGNNQMQIKCVMCLRERRESREAFTNAISQGTAFALSNDKLIFPTSNGLVITALLVEQDTWAQDSDECWVCLTVAVFFADLLLSQQLKTWLVLHENPTSSEAQSGRNYSRLARMMNYGNETPNKEADLLAAIRIRDPERARTLLLSGADPNAMGKGNRTPLQLAAFTGQHEIVEMLLQRNVPVDAHDDAGRTALNFAVDQGSIQTVERLLAHGADPNLDPNEVRLNPGNFQIALIRKHHEMIKVLLKQGARLNEKDSRGWKPLFYALGDFESAKLLIDAGADPNAALSGGSRAIHFAARRGNTALVELLLNHGASVDQRENEGISMLEPTALYRAIDERKEETVEFLLKKGANPNNVFTNSWTCVLLAAKIGNLKILKLVLDHGTHRFQDACEPEGWTALHLAAANGHRLITKILLHAGWNCNSLDASGSTPEMLAKFSGNASTVEVIQDFQQKPLC